MRPKSRFVSAVLGARHGFRVACLSSLVVSCAIFYLNQHRCEAHDNSESFSAFVGMESFLEYNEYLDGWGGCAPYSCMHMGDNQPCSCSTLFDSMFFEILRVIQRKNYVYFLNGGTLLGIQRNLSLWANDEDMDIDIVLDSHGFKMLQRSFEVRRRLYSIGYLLFTDHKINGNMRMCINQFHRCHSKAASMPSKGKYYDLFRFIDIWKMEGLNDPPKNSSAVLEISGYHVPVFTIGNILPLKTFLYQGNHLHIPYNSQAILDVLYPQWQNQVLSKKHGAFPGN